MNALRSLLPLLLSACLTLPAHAQSTPDEGRLQQLQQRWETIHYDLPAKEQEAALAKLAEQAQADVAAEPRSADLLIWRGIVLASWAGAKGGLGALDLVKQARASLEQAQAIDPDALGGSAYVTLASLYYQVPPWPISFGDDDKAEALLKKALAVNPNGIDANYFYGDFLFRQKRYAEAKVALEKALAAPARPDRPRADAGRREEIRARLDDLAGKL